MPPLKFSMLFLFVIYLLSSQFSFTAAADPTYVHHVCSETAPLNQTSIISSLLFPLTPAVGMDSPRVSSTPPLAKTQTGSAASFSAAVIKLPTAAKTVSLLLPEM
ncbi:hypothetical protein CUMW_136790 [Citrus unshiu]|uniref:Uncharacterized protein n=1 Tax=Citrus unshiu TaxID=55188 RepID=A0A2H5PHF9_CITUN|nr:hypothetical protein CUMW_136790 [Citrus unshiu]